MVRLRACVVAAEMEREWTGLDSLNLAGRERGSWFPSYEGFAIY